MHHAIPGTGNEGYLPDLPEWNEDIALAIAARENIPMTAAHREGVQFVRDYLNNPRPYRKTADC